MGISIVVPICNEPRGILENLARELEGQEGEFEVILVDSSDEMIECARFTTLHSKKGRGTQLNVGAKAAKFENLLFLHADSSFEEKDAILRAEQALKTREIGCFRLGFKSENLALKLIALGSNLRVRFRKIAFGDQGIFMRKSLFTRVGGFAEIPIMEDYELGMRLKAMRVGIRQIDSRIITSPRRFERDGIFATLLKMQILQYRFRNGEKASELAKIY